VREGVDFATMTLIDVIQAKRSNQRRKPWPRQSSERRRAATLKGRDGGEAETDDCASAEAHADDFG